MDDLQYYQRRLAHERQAVRDAACQAARERHEKLAEAYQLRCLLLTKVRPFRPASGDRSVPAIERPTLATPAAVVALFQPV